MKRITLATALAVSAMLAGPVVGLAAQPLNMAVTFAPNPPRQGTETVTVILTDGAHKPVSDARVSIAASMPAMSMSAPIVKAVQSRAGVYVATLTLNFATQWKFEVSAKSGAARVVRSYMQNVK